MIVLKFDKDEFEERMAAACTFHFFLFRMVSAVKNFWEWGRSLQRWLCPSGGDQIHWWMVNLTCSYPTKLLHDARNFGGFLSNKGYTRCKEFWLLCCGRVFHPGNGWDEEKGNGFLLSVHIGSMYSSSKWRQNAVLVDSVVDGGKSVDPAKQLDGNYETTVGWSHQGWVYQCAFKLL